MCENPVRRAPPTGNRNRLCYFQIAFCSFVLLFNIAFIFFNMYRNVLRLELLRSVLGYQRPPGGPMGSLGGLNGSKGKMRGAKTISWSILGASGAPGDG